MTGPIEGTLRRIKILIVSPPSLARVIGHLFLGRTEFEVVGAISQLGRLARRRSQLFPDVIVANVKPVSNGIRGVVASIKRYSPSSKLILTCPIEELSSVARQCGADAYLKDDKLAVRLVRTARALSNRPSIANH